MLGGSTVLLFIGMPVVLTFIVINIVGAGPYAGGVLPGVILSVAFVLWVVLRVTISPQVAPVNKDDAVQYRGWARWSLFFGYVLPTLSIFGVMVGALAAGWATPTNAPRSAPFPPCCWPCATAFGAGTRCSRRSRARQASRA